jgi:hypothetical protein
MALKLIGLLMQNMPILFGCLFLAPLIAQIIERLHLTPAGSPGPIIIGLLIGPPWGAVAVWKGRWI